MRKRQKAVLLAGIVITLLAGCGKEEESQVVTLTPAVDPVVQSAPTEAASAENTGAEGDAAESVDTSETSETTEGAETGATENTEASEAVGPTTEEMDALLTQDYAVCFANLTGCDIVKLQITFNAADIQNLEVLGEKRLYDGAQFTYKSSELDGLRGAARLKMSVIATAKDATVMAFPEIDILDPAHTNVVLTASDTGWRMYLQ
ncbi:MAG: hypothetical protein IKO10_14685 [Lachnospiraceae bacterium]|nr:hypothetical protein [Lachnospiraceae bacterium]